MTDVVSLAAELLALQSTTGSEGSAVDFVSRWLVARGWNVSLQEVSRGRSNVWASRSGGGSGVTFSTHLDTVPPYVPPRLEGTRLFGRGASDAKGIAAAMMVAADRLVTGGEKRIDVLLLVGEEKGSDGARAANNLSPTSRFLINGEPTESKLASGAKGSLRATIRTRGREAHSAYPHLGRSGSHIPAQRFATVPGFETGPVAYTSDIPLLSNWGEPLLFGPGSIHVAHTPDEYIDVEELRKSVDVYERLAKTLLAR